MPDRSPLSGVSTASRTFSPDSIKEMVQRISSANDTAKLAEALRVALTALEWYGDERHWQEDDWGVRSVVAHPEYGEPGKKAQNAIKRIGRVTRPEYVAKILQDQIEGPLMERERERV